MARVKVYEGNFDKAYRKFKKQVSNDGLIEEVRARQSYEKPSTKRQRKAAAAIGRQRKKDRDSQLIKPRNY